MIRGLLEKQRIIQHYIERRVSYGNVFQVLSRDFVYQRKPKMSMNQFLPPRGGRLFKHEMLDVIEERMRHSSVGLCCTPFWAWLQQKYSFSSYLNDLLPLYLMSTFSIMYKKPTLPARLQRSQLQLKLDYLAPSRTHTFCIRLLLKMFCYTVNSYLLTLVQIPVTV